MSNSDAVRWHLRSEHFMQALKSKDFVETYQSYHPGVTLMWITSFVETGLKIAAKIRHVEYKTLQNTDGYLLIDGISKITLVIILFILVLLHYKYISALFDPIIALIYVFLIAIEPYMIGINRWYHLTSLEVFLTFGSFLAFLVWADLRIRKYIWISGILLGFAILTKFSSIIALPVFGVVYVITLIKDKNRNLTSYLTDLFVFSALIAGIFVILFPAMWQEPIGVLHDLFLAAQNAQGGEYQSVKFAEANPFLYYFVVLLFKLSPVTLVLSIMALLKALIWRERLTTHLFLFVIFTFSILTFSDQKIERYIISFLPALLLLCAVALSRVEKSLLVITLLVVFSYTSFVYLLFNPVYSGYYDPLLGGPKKAYALGLYDDSGEYYAEAAQYLNTKSRDSITYVPNNVYSFAPYYKGRLVAQPEFGHVNYFIENKDSRRISTSPLPNCDKIERRFYNYNLDAVTIYLCNPYDFE